MRATCEICGRARAMFVCARCGRKACPSCFIPSAWLCRICYEAEAGDKALGARISAQLPWKWLISGLVLMAVGLSLVLLGLALSGKVAILLAPLPIVIVGPVELVILLVMICLILAIPLIFLLALRWGLGPAWRAHGWRALRRP